MTSTAPQTLPIEEALRQGVAHHQAGSFVEAEQYYRAILEAQPDQPDANHNLGILAGQVGQSAAGLPYLKRALAVHPDHGQYLLSYAEALLATGQASDALNLLQSAMQRGLNTFAIQALRLKAEDAARGGPADPTHDRSGGSSLRQLPQAEYDQLAALFNAGRYEELESRTNLLLEQYPDSGFAWKVLAASLQEQGKNALPAMQKATELLPDDAEVHNNFGLTLKDLGRLDESLICHRRALEIRSDFAEAHYNLGNTLKELGQLDDAVASHRRALEIKPDYTEAHLNLGNVLGRLGQLDDAVLSYRRALVINPDFVEAFINQGNVLKVLGQFDDAIKCYHRALEINPDFAEAHYNLGVVQKELGQLDDALKCYYRALEINPDCAEAHYNLGVAQIDLGQLDAALASFRRALEIKPRFADAHSNLIFSLDLSSGVDTATLQQERYRWGSIHAESLIATIRPHDNRPDPARRLRVGYVSADFREHSATVGFGAMLTRFNAAQFEIYAYYNSVTEDSLSRFFQQSVTHWRKIVGLTDAAVAELIRQDSIDILIDLSGHSCGNRLLVFAHKPAPIQISGWGYAGGSGIQAMDVLFSDSVIVPPEEKALYAEEVRYLPSAISAFFFTPFPSVSPPVTATADGIVFGSFNRLAKLSVETFGTWAQILLAIPTSRMVLKTFELDDAGTRAWIKAQFSQAGVEPSRLTLLGGSPWQDHVATFNQIDISLDPFPQSGGVTTLEGLMMGVPVVTLHGNTFVGRGSSSILTTLGLNDWIAKTPAQYVDIAVQKAKNPVDLSELRLQLRDRLTSSIIGDLPAYVKVVEQEYRQIWQEWCIRHQAASESTENQLSRNCP